MQFRFFQIYGFDFISLFKGGQNSETHTEASLDGRLSESEVSGQRALSQNASKTAKVKPHSPNCLNRTGQKPVLGPR